MRNIKLYIEDNLIELPNQLSIPMNFTLEDVNNPAVKKIGYSKTISIEGTNSNNQIFGEIWNLERIQDYDILMKDRIYFNPSKRVDAKIFINDELKYEGYVRLDSISYNKPQIVYSLTFYSGLGDFFYSLSANEEGDERTLAELDYGYDLGFKISKDIVLGAWDALKNNTGGKYQIINFAPAYNGIPDDFSADEALINVDSFEGYFPTTIPETGYTPVNGFALADLNNEYTDIEMDLRSYLQRPVLRVKSLIQAMDDPDINGGYHLELDRSFFNEDNPYWENAWITLPLLKSLDNVGGEVYTGTSLPVAERLITVTPVDSFPMEFTGQISGETIDMGGYSYGTFNYIVPVSFRVAASAQGGISPIGSNLYPSYKLDYTRHFVKRFDEEGNYHLDYSATETMYVSDYVGARLIVRNADTDEIIASSNQYVFTNWANNVDVISDIPVTRVEGCFKYDNGQWIFTGPNGNTEFEMELTNVPVAERVTFQIQINRIPTFLYNGDYGKMVEENTEDQGFVITDSTPFPFEHNNHYYSAGSGDLAFTEEASAHSGVEISQQKLLGNLRTPCDYLLSYAKMFGLYFVKHPYENTITLMARNKFFKNEIVDLNENIDWGSNPTMKPILFDSKWYTLKNEAEESEFIEKYANDYNADYGEQKINTGYNFDSEENDIMSGSKFKTAVFARGKSKYYRTFKEGGIVVPCCMYDGITYNLFKESGNTYANASQDMVMSGGTYANWYPMKGGYDCFPKLDFKDSDNGSVNGENVLCFFDGFRNMVDNSGNEIVKYVTDDVPEMWILNDETPCWFITAEETENATEVTELPCFSRYMTNGNNITKSLDYGEPKELYVDNLHSSSETTVYNQFWKAFLNDQLDINTRIFTANVKFDEILNEDNLRNIYYFQNSYWILNKIVDYDICSFNTVKCEFIKIQDRNDYIKGQVLPYLDAHIYIEGQRFYNYGIPTGATSGTLALECANVENVRLTETPNWLAMHLNGDNTQLVYSALENDTEISRRTQIRVVGENVVDGEEVFAVLNVTQAPRQTMLQISPQSRGVPAQSSSNTYRTTIWCNGNWQVSSKPDWVNTLAGSSGTYDGEHIYWIENNESTESRRGEILYTSGNKVAVQYLTQDPAEQPPVPPTPTGATKIYYTSTDGRIVTPHITSSEEWGANIVSNTYVNGQGCIEFDEPITEIPDFAFRLNSTIVYPRWISFILPEGITSIGKNAFDNGASIREIIMPNSVTNIGEGAFYNCSSLTGITLSNNITSIGDGAFRYCTSLRELTIPSGVTNIGDYTFYECTALTRVSIPSGVTNIGDYAFYGCSSLTGITIPSRVTSISRYTFSRCTSLTGITLSNNITNIGKCAFSHCTSLRELTIPSSVTSIGIEAFGECTALTRINVLNPVPPVMEEVWADPFMLTDCPIIVPCSSVNAYKEARGWGTYYASRIVGDC